MSGIDLCLPSGISNCPIRKDPEDRNAHVTVGTDLCRTRNLTVIRGDETGKVPFLGRASHSWGVARVYP